MALGISVEMVIKARFNEAISSMQEAGQNVADNFVNNMTTNAGKRIQEQIDEAENLFASATAQASSLNASAATQMGNLASIATNTANPMAASASPSMLLTLSSNVSGLKGQIDGVNDTLTNLSEIIRKLGIVEGDKLEVVERDGGVFLCPVVVYPKAKLEQIVQIVQDHEKTSSKTYILSPKTTVL